MFWIPTPTKLVDILRSTIIMYDSRIQMHRYFWYDLLAFRTTPKMSLFCDSNPIIIFCCCCHWILLLWQNFVCRKTIHSWNTPNPVNIYINFVAGSDSNAILFVDAEMQNISIEISIIFLYYFSLLGHRIFKTLRLQFSHIF